VGLIEHDYKDDIDEKQTGKAVSQLEFFNHETNATVTIGFDTEEQIAQVGTTPAEQYQPEITVEEIDEAAQIARAYFRRHGQKRIAKLKAYGLLAYKPEGLGFFDARVLYISFHKHDDAPPELMAWVDLTNQRVLKAREER